MPRPHCHDHLISGRLPLHSDCVENTEARCSHRNPHRGRFFVRWLIRSTWIHESSRNACFHLLSNFEGPFWQAPQSIAQLWGTITEAVVFIKNVYETPCETKKLEMIEKCVCMFRFKSSTYLTNIVYINVLLDMNTGSQIQLCIFWVGCHPSDSHLAIQPVDYVSDLCMWLAFWRLSPICFSLYWLSWILWKPCHGAIWRLTLKNLFFLQKTDTDNNSTQRDVAMKATASFIGEKITQDCLKKVFACSGPNQAHNLTNIFCMNVFSNMNPGSGIQLCIFLVGCHPSDSHLAMQPVDYVSDLCMWLAFWRLSPICFSLYWLSWILWKPCHGAIWRLTLKNLFFLQKYTDNNSTQRDVAMKATASFIREN